jgi:hypothetical protein
MPVWCFDAWRRAIGVSATLAVIAGAPRLAAQAVAIDSTARGTPDVRLTAVGAAAVYGRLERATRDTLFVLVSDQRFTVLRRDVAQLELKGPVLSATEASQQRVLGVLKGGLITTGIAAGVGSLPCLSTKNRNGDSFFPCYFLGAFAAGIGIPTTLVLAVVTGAVSSVPKQTWLPVDASTWRISLDAPALSVPSVARPLLSFRVAF